MKKPVVLGLVIAALVAVIAGGTWWYQSRQDNGLTAISRGRWSSVRYSQLSALLPLTDSDTEKRRRARQEKM